MSSIANGLANKQWPSEPNKILGNIQMGAADVAGPRLLLNVVVAAEIAKGTENLKKSEAAGRSRGGKPRQLSKSALGC